RRLARQESLPEQERAAHQAEARRCYAEAIKRIDSCHDPALASLGASTVGLLGFPSVHGPLLAAPGLITWSAKGDSVAHAVWLFRAESPELFGGEKREN